uniref:Uncharacterized protein n=1 Tax=Oryza rufipogon TaxID=4529 RepID=A0A0E0R431_ORYRU
MDILPIPWGTYAFDTNSIKWHKVDNKKLPFTGCAAPHGSVFLGLSKDNGPINAYRINVTTSDKNHDPCLSIVVLPFCSTKPNLREEADRTGMRRDGPNLMQQKLPIPMGQKSGKVILSTDAITLNFWIDNEGMDEEILMDMWNTEADVEVEAVLDMGQAAKRLPPRCTA